MSVLKFDRGKALYDSYLRLSEEGKSDEAGRNLLEAVACGEVLAMHALAYEIYGSDPDRIPEALDLYRRAARKGFEPSAWNLVRHYDITHQAKNYFYWLKRSAEMGEPDAVSEIENPFPYTVEAGAELEDRGLIKEAKRLYRLAAQWGNASAVSSLQRLSKPLNRGGSS